jgi:hypothetical protein
MLHNVKALKGYKLDSLDEEIGTVKEFYFDDRFWTIRYLVADTGNWLPGRQVLISPYALVAINRDNIYDLKIEVDLTKQQIENSPSLETDMPISHQFENAYYGHYGWPTYWGGPHIWGSHPYIMRNREKWRKSTESEKAWDPHLRSTNGVNGHHIQAVDGEIGHVEDFLIDDETWTIRYLIIATHNWWPGKNALVSPRWIERVSWGERKVFVNLTREAIKQSPEYPKDYLLTRDYETALHQHYDRQGYWVDEPALSRESPSEEKVGGLR